MGEDHETLIKKLKEMDPDRLVRTDCSSKKRVVRSLEVAIFKKKNPESALEQTSSLDLNSLVLCVTWERSKLRERIDLRLEQRLKQGMVDEVKRLLLSGISEERFSLFGMEYKHVARYVKNEVTYKTMISELQNSIHQLAKRQETWFRGMEKRGIKMHWVPEADTGSAIDITDRYFKPVQQENKSIPQRA
jgi:tRNA dimethylallyltransferase